MDKLLATGQRLKKSRYSICRIMGKVLLWIPLYHAGSIEKKAEKENLPESWENQDSKKIQDKIWEIYKKNK